MRITLIGLVAILGIAASWLLTQDSPEEKSTPVVIEPDSSAPKVLVNQIKTLSADVIKEATQHITALTSPEDTPIDIKSASHFVTAEQLLKLPIAQSDQGVSLQALTGQPAKNAPQGIALIADNITTDTAVASPTADIGAQIDANETATNTTLATVASSSFAVETSTGLKTQQPTATALTQQVLIVGQTTSRPLHITNTGEIRLKELLDQPEKSKNQLFYLHAVRDTDKQGLWGIIQYALIDTFTNGITLPNKQHAVTAEIPTDADERLHDSRSSFLGHVLQNKVDETYVYNYAKGSLGQNPDLITPGQQLVIVTFSEEELIQIYDYFVQH